MYGIAYDEIKGTLERLRKKYPSLEIISGEYEEDCY